MAIITLTNGGQYTFAVIDGTPVAINGTTIGESLTWTSACTFNSSLTCLTGVQGGTIAGTTGTFTGNVSGAEGIFTGDVTAYSTSDKRFKDNIFIIDNPIDKIKKISGVEFDWNEEAPEWTKSETQVPLHDVGVIAQEVQKIIPEAVKVRADKSLAVDYKRLIPLLIEGIKEQQNTIESLETRIKILENK